MELAAKHGLSRHIETLLSEVADGVPEVAAAVSREIPQDFPEQVAESIFAGMSRAAARLTAG